MQRFVTFSRCAKGKNHGLKRSVIAADVLHFVEDTRGYTRIVVRVEPVMRGGVERQIIHVQEDCDTVARRLNEAAEEPLTYAPPAYPGGPIQPIPMRPSYPGGPLVPWPQGPTFTDDGAVTAPIHDDATVPREHVEPSTPWPR